jgi:hypothetical protein
MQFKPIDEFSLRHLFSSEQGEKILKISYLGPILNASGQMETSPDCFVIDRRDRQKILRCEFKYDPFSYTDFAHNGQFDIAIVWQLTKISKEKLLTELRNQNGCKEILVLSNYLIFSKLKDYNHVSIDSIETNHQLAIKTIAKNTSNFATVYASYIAAKMPNLVYSGKKMLALLKEKFPLEFLGVKPQGVSNIITSHTMTKLKLIKKIRKDYYQWNNEINADTAASVLAEVIEISFGRELPSEDVFEKLR